MRTPHILAAAVIAAVGAAPGAAQQVPAGAQTSAIMSLTVKVYSACYVPGSGAVYLIGEQDTPTECSTVGKHVHVPFSWTDGIPDGDHGVLNGLGDDDHPQYLLADGTRALSGDLSAGGYRLTGLAAGTANGDAVRFEQAVKSGDAAGGDLGGTYPNPTVAKLQGQAVSSTAPTAGQVLAWDDGSMQWAPTSPAAVVTDHGGLGGLTDDDHSQYLLGNGSRNAIHGFAVTGALNAGTPVVSGAGTRLLWYPGKAAFRAGFVGGTQWDDANMGLGSAAFGLHTTASGQGSLAVGQAARATGSSSAAFGLNALASGFDAFAFGQNSQANGQHSFAANGGRADGTGAVAVGQGTVATGVYSIALNNQSSTTGNYSVAAGVLSVASSHAAIALGDRSTAGGPGSVALGVVNDATGQGAAGIGQGNTASGTAAAAIGFSNTASGGGSAAIGNDNTATNSGAVALGLANTASGIGSAAIGRGNQATGQASIALGWNAVTQRTDGSPANLVFLFSDGVTPQTTSDAQFVVGARNGIRLFNGVGDSRFAFEGGTGSGCRILGGGLTCTGAISGASDAAAKERFESLDPQVVLDRLLDVPVLEWSYRASPGIRHIGPTAQAFRAAFGLGDSDRSIATVDADGINMLAIQALAERVREVQTLRADVDRLRSELDDLRSEVARLVDAMGSRR